MTESFLDIDTWLQCHSFKPGFHPFEEYVAERDKNLDEEATFIQFPYFNEIEKPKTTFLFLRRGTGKSANRLILENRIDRIRNNIVDLSVTYTDFSGIAYKEKISLQDHVEAILDQTVTKLFQITTKPERVDLINNLSDQQKAQFVWFLAKYSNCLEEASLRKQIEIVARTQNWDDEKRTKALDKVTKLAFGAFGEAAKITIPGGNLLFDAITTLLELKATKSTDNLPKQIPHSPLDFMKQFSSLANDLNIRNIYIFVDRVDEFSEPHDFTEIVERLLKPLVMTVPLLEMSPYAFKFFLPSETFHDMEKIVRFDRFSFFINSDINNGEWQEKHLRDLIARRLAFCCDERKTTSNERRSFERLFTDRTRTGRDIVGEIIYASNGSPRNMIRIAKAIFDEHTRLPAFGLSISQETYINAIQKHR